LRAIMEDIMLEVMYDLPSRGDVVKCIVNRDVVLKQRDPILVPAAAAKAEGKGKEETA